MLSDKDFTDLIAKWTPYIRHQVLKHRHEDGEDAVQDALLHIWRMREKYDPQKGAFATWVWWQIRSLMQVRRGYKFKRAAINQPMEFFEDGEPRFEAIATQGDPHASLELKEAVAAACRLKPRERTAVLGRAVGDTFDEIGAVFNSSSQYGQQLHALGLKNLRKMTRAPLRAGAR